MIKPALITIAIVSTIVWGSNNINDMVDTLEQKTNYYHCTRTSGALTDMETVKADQYCREATGYKGE